MARSSITEHILGNIVDEEVNEPSTIPDKIFGTKQSNPIKLNRARKLFTSDFAYFWTVIVKCGIFSRTDSYSYYFCLLSLLLLFCCLIIC